MQCKRFKFMKRLKSIFNTLYFSYLILSVLLFFIYGSLSEQMDPGFLMRFINFWLILGFAFFISIWVIQAVHIGLLMREINDLESKVMELKSKLYDFNKDSPLETESTKLADVSKGDSESSISQD